MQRQLIFSEELQQENKTQAEKICSVVDQNNDLA